MNKSVWFRVLNNPTVFRLDPSGIYPVASASVMSAQMVDTFGDESWRVTEIGYDGKPIYVRLVDTPTVYKIIDGLALPVSSPEQMTGDMIAYYGDGNWRINELSPIQSNVKAMNPVILQTANPVQQVAPVSEKVVSQPQQGANNGGFSGSINFGKETNRAWLPFVLIAAAVLILVFRPFKFISGLFK